MSTPAPIVIAPSAAHTSTLIFFHGLGDSGNGWAEAMKSIRIPSMKVICPTAPRAPVSLNAGFEMPSWFDLKTLDISAPEDEIGIRKATEKVHAMITSEINGGIPANRIIIGGFSQGGALALYSALTFEQQIGGVMALSCWLPIHKQFPGYKKSSDTLPILQCHGDCDPVVPYKFGQMSSSLLKNFMKDVHFISYRGLSHSSSDEELTDMKKFIEKNMS